MANGSTDMVTDCSVDDVEMPFGMSDQVVEVTVDQVKAALYGSPVISTNDDAMRVAAHVGSHVFRVGTATYFTQDTKL